MTDKLGINLKEIFNGDFIYCIPFYQRNFAWKQKEIEELLQDIYSNYKLQNDNLKGKYFIGSLVVFRCKENPNKLEVIDGQQRLTVLSLMIKILGLNEKCCITYDSRDKAIKFFNDFYGEYETEKEEFEYLRKDNELINFQNAISFIEETNLNVEDDEKNKVTIKTLKEIPNKLKSFANYFYNNVYLVRVELPENTDVASYFEIMNNRGIQLQKHELIKAQMMSMIKMEEKRVLFSKIWNACSEMDVPVQKFFDKSERNTFWGINYNKFNGIPTLRKRQNKDSTFSIDEILSKSETEKDKLWSFEENIENDDENKPSEDTNFSTIIDFSNFLMHVFKLFYNEEYKRENENEEIPLNEKNIIKVFSDIEGGLKKKNKEFEPMIFAKHLLFTRTLFDRFIVKTERRNGEEHWVLCRPQKYKKSTSYNIGTFEGDIQERLIKAMSMLQVTYRTRIYKNWLQEALRWLVDRTEEDNDLRISGEDYLYQIDKIIYKNFCTNFKIEDDKTVFDEENFYSMGTKTPHFLFNLIDYLYWIEKAEGNCSLQKVKSEIKLLKKGYDFEFKYWNSVEHHLAQKKAKEYDERKNTDKYKKIVDCLGNLCLISKNANSSLSDRDVKEKIEKYIDDNSEDSISPNRMIIYQVTRRNNNTWSDSEIKEHYKALVELLDEEHIKDRFRISDFDIEEMKSIF